jgi:hypothetical protein
LAERDDEDSNHGERRAVNRAESGFEREQDAPAELLEFFRCFTTNRIDE